MSYLKAKIKVPVFRKLSVMNILIPKEKTITEVLRIKNLKYD